ncbi:type II 3-dehydroquinate dehydratase [Fulvivirgaceae bacterium BMA12]|uniref:3-dehydroquinate dehydratase n=1 Tax=Agaribacillus aureus TaxID=3051825 RepID=A0ABT8L3K8_9BACT|nr:type II 3-dehydroquinate dehydratase [Fulvivirgaceae bacterium BMA12]
MKILILNGPNLNLLGVREKSIYGEDSFDVFFDKICQKFSEVDLSYFQSNIEGEIIDKLHATGFDHDGIILNAGGYTHTSVAIADAIAAINTPVFEVHISNIYAREDFRHKSLLSKNCIGIISGIGLAGYEMALVHLINKR